MLITLDFLKSKGACLTGLRYFKENFGESADYQAVLDKLAADDRVSDARWLLDNAGSDKDAVREITETPATRHVFAAGRLEIKIDISVAGCVFAGSGIKAGLGISAGEGIKAGEGISAGWGISAGKGIKAGEGISAGWGIKAGFSIRCKRALSARLRIFAGLVSWRMPTPEEQEIECAKLEQGTVALGFIKETDAAQEAAKR